MFFKALLLSAALEFGFLSGGVYNYHAHNAEWEDIGTLYANTSTTVTYKTLYITGAMECYFTPLAWNNYSPFQMTYIVGVGVKLENIELGYEHSCFHPMQPYATVVGNEIKPKYEGAYNRFFVRIETK